MSQAPWRVFIVLVMFMSVTLPLAACTASDQAALATAAAEAAQTVAAAAKTRVAVEAQTVVAAGGTRAVRAGQTAVAAAETQAAQAAQTALAAGSNAAQTQVAALKTRLAGASPIPDVTVTPEPGAYRAAYRAPYEACDTQSDHTASPDSGTWKLLEEGFSSAFAVCDAAQGTINAGALVFGSKDGNVLQKDPDQEAHASGQMRLELIPSFTGNLRIEASLVVSANLGAAAGSAMALPDVISLLEDILITDDIIGGFIDVAQGLILATFGGAKGEAYLTATTNDQTQETRLVIGEHGVGASFPVPPLQQQKLLSGEPIALALEIPVQRGQPVEIVVGVAVEALTKGWATAYWNPWKKHEAVVTGVLLTEQ